MIAEDEILASREYAEKIDIQTTFEDALTNLLVSHPEDAMGFLYDQIVKKSAPPFIEKVIGREIVDGHGFPTIEVEIWGKVHGKSEFLGKASAPSVDYCRDEDVFVLFDSASQRFSGRGMRQAVSVVASLFQPVLENKKFDDQKVLDASLVSADGTTNRKKSGANTMMATSAAIAIASSRALKVPLYIHLIRTFSKREHPVIPRPIFAIFSLRTGPVSKVYLIPTPNAQLEDQIRIVCEIYFHYSQGTMTQVCSDGTFSLSCDKLDDIMQTVEAAVSGGGHTLGSDVFLGFSGNFDNDDVQFWEDLFTASSSVAYVEDPLPLDNTSGLSTIASKCKQTTILSIGRGIISNAEKITATVPGRAIVIRPAQAATITNSFAAAEAVEKVDKVSVFATSKRDTSDTWIVDLAIAAGASFIQLGPPAIGDNICKINRMLEIFRDMETAKKKEDD